MQVLCLNGSNSSPNQLKTCPLLLRYPRLYWIDDRHRRVRAARGQANFVGVKYTNPDREQLRSILAADDAPDMLWGCDEELYDDKN